MAYNPTMAAAIPPTMAPAARLRSRAARIRAAPRASRTALSVCLMFSMAALPHLYHSAKGTVSFLPKFPRTAARSGEMVTLSPYPHDLN
jgi:hypothetical protein